tara:strand:+ start:25 stop:570 length:546 start_codon:yes stop_codon:yes gene_type:complete
MNIGLFFGSFNPVHNGHINIVKEVINKTDIDNIWMILSPQNPEKEILMEKEVRFQLLDLATKNLENVSISKIEFDMPLPNYTYKTLKRISNDNPSENFKLIIGGDNYRNIHKWKESKFILDNYEIIVYPRSRKDLGNSFTSKLFNVSSSQVRNLVMAGKSIKSLVPDCVEKKIISTQLYLK